MALRLLQTLRSKLPWLETLNPALLDMGRPVVLISLAVTGLLIGLGRLDLLEGMNLALYDQLLRLRPDEGEDDRLLVVGITEEDIQRRQEWPISDRTLAQVLQQLEAHEPRVIGLDVIRDVPIEPGRTELLQELQKSDRIVTVCKGTTAEDTGFAPPPDVAPESVGFADLVIDPGGILRRSLLLMVPPPPITNFPGQLSHLCNQPNTIPSLGLQLAIYYLQAEGIEPVLTDDGELWFGKTHLTRFQSSTGGYEGADANGYQILLNYRSAKNAVQQVSLADVLEGRFDPAWIRDRIVLIGYTTPQAKDEFYTPFSAGLKDSQKMPGVIVHAQATSQIVSAVLDGRKLLWVWPDGVERLWDLGWALVGGLVGWYIRHPLRFGAVLLVSIGSLYGLSFLVLLNGGWIPLVPGAIACLTTAVGVVLLDRFNKSEYGQTVYRQVKSFLKLEIEIDHEKLEKQVAEITETDYFHDLQQKAKTLRSNVKDDVSNDSPEAPIQPQSPPLMGPESSADPEPEFDLSYLQHLRQETRRLREQREQPPNGKE